MARKSPPDWHAKYLEAESRIKQLESDCDTYSANAGHWHTECDRLQNALSEVIDLVDDVLYDPRRYYDEQGREIKGNDKYLLDLPIQRDHLPALRTWFVRQDQLGEEAAGAGV